MRTTPLVILASVTDLVPANRVATRVKTGLRSATRDSLLIQGFLAAVLASLVAFPFLNLGFLSFSEEFPIREVYIPTIANYQQLFSNPDFILRVTIDTLIYAFFTSVFAIILGTFAAITIVKFFRDTKLKIFIFFPYTIPSVAAVTAWVLLLGRQGVVNVALMRVFGLEEAPIDLYSIAGMIWVETLITVPLAFLFIAPAVRSIPAAIDEASIISGASTFKTLREIVLPLLTPAVFSAFVYLFLRNMASVSTPSVLGPRGGIYTFGSLIPMYFLGGGSYDFGQAMAFSIVLTLLSGVLIYLYMRIQAQEGKYETVSGQGGADLLTYDVSNLKRYSLAGVLLVYSLIGGFIPFFSLVWDALLPGEYLILALDPSVLTLANFEAMIEGSAGGVGNWQRSLVNTFALAIIVPSFVVTTAMLVSFANQGVKMRLGWLLSFVAAVTLGVPAVVKSLAFLVSFITTPIYGTRWIILVAFMGATIPIAMRYTSPALTKVGKELIEAAVISGSRELRTFRHIIIPVTTSEFGSAWVHMYSYVVRVLPIPILLYAAGSEMVSVEIFLVLQAGYTKPASILSLISIFMILIPFVAFTFRDRLNPQAWL